MEEIRDGEKKLVSTVEVEKQKQEMISKRKLRLLNRGLNNSG